MRNLLFLFLAFTLSYCDAQVEIPNKDQQIKYAVLAAPKDKQEGATVLGFDSDNNVVTLREGTNEIICLADNPQQDGFSVAAYHKDLEPFMKRGRELRGEGLGFQEVFDMREKEAKAGKLKMPDHAATLHVLSGKEANYNETTGVMEGTAIRWVVYIPWSTPESSGLPTSPPSPGAPWIMFPGTHAAHIMITPPRE